MRPLALRLARLAQPALCQTPASEPARPVISETITPGPVQVRSFMGTVEAGVTINLAFLTRGPLASPDVAAGDKVTAGSTPAALDQAPLNEDIAAAKAALQEAGAKAQFARQRSDRVQELVKPAGHLPRNGKARRRHGRRQRPASRLPKPIGPTPGILPAPAS